MSGINGNVIMSGCLDGNPDDARRERLEMIQRVYRRELTVIEAAMVWASVNGSSIESRHESPAREPIYKHSAKKRL
jgi:hypothetical protein